MNPLAARLDEGLGRMDLDLAADTRAQLLALVDLLAHWNRAYNLTAVRDPLEMIGRHLLDSLAALPYLRGPRLLDLGTGAGLPGLPLAICRPHLRWVLLDANGKKIRFVRQAMLELGLDNVEPVQGRIQSYRPKQKFATITARACAALADLTEMAGPHLAPGGVLLAFKGRKATAELTESGLRGEVHCIQVPFVEGARAILEIPSTEG